MGDKTDSTASSVTQILSAMQSGDLQGSEDLLPLVYKELRNLAVSKMAHEKPGHTLQATALVHEAYLRLVNVAKPQEWNGRRHFFAAAALAMQRILIEASRQKKQLKRGGHFDRVEFFDVIASEPAERLTDLSEALEHLEKEDPVAASVVRLHRFSGFTHAEVSKALEIPPSRVREKWDYARAWLRDAMSDNE